MSRDNRAMAAVFGLKPKGSPPPEEDGEPEGEDDPESDQDFDDAWREYAEAMKSGDDEAACTAMRSMIDIRIASKA